MVKLTVFSAVALILLGYISNITAILRMQEVNVESKKMGLADTNIEVVWCYPWLIRYAMTYKGVAVTPPRWSILLFGYSVYELPRNGPLIGTNW